MRVYFEAIGDHTWGTMREMDSIPRIGELITIEEKITVPVIDVVWTLKNGKEPSVIVSLKAL